MITPPWAIDPDVDTLVDLFENAVANHGDADAIVDRDRRLTYTEWWTQAGGLAEQLRSRGVGAGSVVAIALPSSAEYAVAYAAIARLGAVATGINPRHGVGEVAYVLDKAEPAVIICGQEFESVLPDRYRARSLDVERFPEL